MRRLKNLFMAFMVAFLLSPSLAFAHVHNSGEIEIKVLDQEGQEIGGFWSIYPGTGSGGTPLRNGTLGEVFRVYDPGFYFLAAQRKEGYERFEITSPNPQEMVPRGTITFTLVYYKTNSDAAAETPETPAEEEAPDEPEAPAEEEGGMTEEEMAPSLEEEEFLLEEFLGEEVTPRMPDRSLLPSRTPLHVEPPPAASETLEVMPASEPEEESGGMGGPVMLAVTGPESLLALLALSGMGGYLCLRRRRA